MARPSHFIGNIITGNLFRITYSEKKNKKRVTHNHNLIDKVMTLTFGRSYNMELITMSVSLTVRFHSKCNANNPIELFNISVPYKT